MKIAVMSWSFARDLRSGELSNSEVVRFVHGLGVSGIELMDGLIRDDEFQPTRAALAETEMKVVCYDLSADFVMPERADRRAAVEKARRGLENAARFGAPLALVVPGALKASVSPAVARAWIIEGLRACVPIATRLGLTLTIEDHSSQAAVYGRSAHLIQICDAVGPHLAVTYDVGNFLLAREDPLAAADCLAGRIVHAHFKDWQIVAPSEPPPPRGVVGVDGTRYTGAVLGEGMLDLPGATTRLQRVGYDGYVSVEYEGPGDPRATVRRGVDLLQTLLHPTSGEE
ncbi:MAG: sugar phosphate isomerase/epimerase family protein [Chloroflexota bacterium]